MVAFSFGKPVSIFPENALEQRWFARRSGAELFSSPQAVPAVLGAKRNARDGIGKDPTIQGLVLFPWESCAEGFNTDHRRCG
jgi:hypothetical protein